MTGFGPQQHKLILLALVRKLKDEVMACNSSHILAFGGTWGTGDSLDPHRSRGVNKETCPFMLCWVTSRGNDMIYLTYSKKMGYCMSFHTKHYIP